MINAFMFWLFVESSRIGLTNRDLCIRINKGKQEKFCSDLYSYECGSDKCAISKQACSYYKTLNFTLRRFQNLANHKSELEKFEKFNKLRECPGFKPKWMPIHVCHNKTPRNCDLNTVFKVYLKLDGLGECSCPMKYPYSCERRVCSTNKKECLMFRNELKIRSLKVFLC